jgi:hypothetical protein
MELTGREKEIKQGDEGKHRIKRWQEGAKVFFECSRQRKEASLVGGRKEGREEGRGED